MGDLLTVYGMQCRLYATAEQFLLGLGREAIGCIVSDLRLPGMDGLALQRELTARGVTTPMVLVTSASTPQLRVSARRAGIRAVLSKPVRAPTLIAEIKAILTGPDGEAPGDDDA